MKLRECRFLYFFSLCGIRNEVVFLLLEHSSLRGLNQGLIQAAFDIDIPILGTLIWACLNLILRKIETTIKCVSSFLIKSITYCEHNKKKIINKCNVSSFGLLNDILGHQCVAILLVKMLIWAPFSQSMCSFSFCINTCKQKKFWVLNSYYKRSN